MTTSQQTHAAMNEARRDDDDVQLEEDSGPPFEPRDVKVKKHCRIYDEYDVLEFLGRGKFGEVKKCRERATGKYLAAKFIATHRSQDKCEVENELEIMRRLQHPRLLQLYDAFEAHNEMCLILELILGGELFERVIDDDFVLTERLCELYMLQICEGVKYIHEQSVLHLDMKPENILCLNRNGHRIKIIDFGLARQYQSGESMRVLFGTPEFVAPEVIGFDTIGFGTDMWSVGVIAYVLLSGLSPFMGDSDAETLYNVEHAQWDFDDESFNEISAEAKEFISKLLVKDRECRSTADQCLQHPWLQRHRAMTALENEKQLCTKKLRRFVIRRRWQKAVNALLALRRMGVALQC